MKHKDVFFLCDLSTNISKHINDIRDVINETVWRIDALSYPRWNIYVNLLTFDGGIFSGSKNIPTRHRLIKNYEAPMLTINTQNAVKGNVDGMFRAAFDMSLSQYNLWILNGVEASPALFIYISDVSFNYFTGKSETDGINSNFLQELQIRLKHSNIDIRVLALDTFDLEADNEKLRSVAGREDFVVSVRPFKMIDKNLFLDIFD